MLEVEIVKMAFNYGIETALPRFLLVLGCLIGLLNIWLACVLWVGDEDELL